MSDSSSNLRLKSPESVLTSLTCHVFCVKLFLLFFFAVANSSNGTTALIHGLTIIYDDGANWKSFQTSPVGLLWPSMFSMDRNLIARVTLCYVPMPGLPSLPYQSPSMVSIPPPLACLQLLRSNTSSGPCCYYYWEKSCTVSTYVCNGENRCS